MVDVGAKPETFRRALARGAIRLGAQAFPRVRDRRVPKGDVLALAEVAGIQAAKKASEWLPLCHPLLVDKVAVRCLLDEADLSARVECEVRGTGKTGFEMEALTGVSAALLCIYDLVKSIEPGLEMGDIRLVEKEGGKSGHWVNPAASPAPEERARISLAGTLVGIVTVSDRVSRGIVDDRSGVVLREFLDVRGALVAGHSRVPDEGPAIAGAIRLYAREHRARLVLLTGGTGLGPRDVTPEAVASVCDRLVPGIGELLRSEGARATPMSWLSRSVAGLLGDTLVVALPGSAKAVRECLIAIEKLLPHALHVAAGGDHDRRAAEGDLGTGGVPDAP